MPNNVCNLMRFTGNKKTIKTLMMQIACDDPKEFKNLGIGTIDFRKIKPEPKYKNRGDWYDWRIEKWGTKWNAYDQKKCHSDNELCFLTAWSTPVKIFESISQLYPKLSIEVSYADEDTGYNCGKFIFEGGEMVANLKMTYSNYSETFAKKIWKKYKNI